MKNLKFSLLIVMAVFTACQKEKNDLTVTLKTSGALNVQLVDNTGSKFDNVKVHLYTYYSSPYSTTSTSFIYGGELDTKVSDSNGNANFGTIAEGTYYVVTDTIQKAGQKYLISKALQVTSGDSKNMVLNPLEFIGKLKFSLEIYNNGMRDTLTRTKIKIALVNNLDYSNNLNRSQVIKKAIAVKSFDANGRVEFDNVPSNIYYYPYVFVDNTDTIGDWSRNGAIMVTKDNTYSGIAYVYFSGLIIPKSSLSLTLQYYNNGYKAVPSANVVLVRYNDYYSYNLSYASVSTVLLYAVKKGITNSSGTVTFTDVPASVEYYTFVYYSTSKYLWDTNYIYPYSNSVNNYTRNVSGTALGL